MGRDKAARLERVAEVALVVADMAAAGVGAYLMALGVGEIVIDRGGRIADSLYSGSARFALGAMVYNTKLHCSEALRRIRYTRGSTEIR